MKQINPYSPIPALLFIAFSFLLPAGLASAATVDALQWEITADKLTRYEDPPSVIAEGNVILEKKETSTKPRTAEKSRWSDLLGEKEKTAGKPAEAVTETKTMTKIRADWVAYDVQLGKVRARGKLQIVIGPDQLEAESGSIDLKEATGVFENATIVRQYKDMHFQGRVIEKTGDLTYHIEDGWIVTCKLQKGETPPWSFGAADAEITDGGYAFLKHATFRIKDVPVLYTPVLLLPAKRTRQTGFLFPSIYMSSRDGFSLETPFFINLSPSADITLFPRYLTERGFMGGAEFRYVVDEHSKGVFMGNYLYDDKLSDLSEGEYYQDGQYSHTNSDRYWLRGKTDQNFGEWITRLDLDVVSDRDYLREFNSGSTGISSNQSKFLGTFGRGFQEKTDKYRKNTVGFLRSWDSGTSLQGEFLAINDVSDITYDPDNPSKAWSLPSILYSGLIPVTSSGGTDFSWDAGFANFWREEGVGAQRLDFLPELTTSIPLTPYLETTAKGGVRDTYYTIQDNGASDWQDTDSENRFLYNMGGEIGTSLMRDFGGNGNGSRSWSHMARPYVSYTYTSIPDKVVLPQFDRIDRLEDENIIYYGVNNFFKIYEEQKNREFDRDYAFVKIKQGYDMRSEESDTPLTPVEIQSGFYPMRGLRVKYVTNIDTYEDGMYYHAVETDYFSNRGDVIGLDYRYNDVTDINSISGSIWYFLPYNFAAGYSLEKSINDVGTLEEKIRLLYQPACWSVEFSSNYTPGDQTYMVTFRLANIGTPFGIDVPGF